jgi:hypothetical protein
MDGTPFLSYGAAVPLLENDKAVTPDLTRPIMVADWYSPLRFALVLAALILAAFPQVWAPRPVLPSPLAW